jgi:hypothetical protein
LRGAAPIGILLPNEKIKMISFFANGINGCLNFYRPTFVPFPLQNRNAQTQC